MFAMQRGIRQGCALSLLNFAIFTGWIFDQLCARVSKEWATEFITLFADDFLLQWSLTQAEDLVAHVSLRESDLRPLAGCRHDCQCI